MEDESNRIKKLEECGMVPKGTSGLSARQRVLAMNAARNHHSGGICRFIESEAQEELFRSLYVDHSIVRYSAIAAPLVMFTKSVISMSTASTKLNGFILVAIPLVPLKKQYGHLVVSVRGYVGVDPTQGVDEIIGDPFDSLFSPEQTAPTMDIDTHLKQREQAIAAKQSPPKLHLPSHYQHNQNRW